MTSKLCRNDEEMSKKSSISNQDSIIFVSRVSWLSIWVSFSREKYTRRHVEMSKAIVVLSRKLKGGLRVDVVDWPSFRGSHIAHRWSYLEKHERLNPSRHYLSKRPIEWQHPARGRSCCSQSNSRVSRLTTNRPDVDDYLSTCLPTYLPTWREEPSERKDRIRSNFVRSASTEPDERSI